MPRAKSNARKKAAGMKVPNYSSKTSPSHLKYQKERQKTHQLERNRKRNQERNRKRKELRGKHGGGKALEEGDDEELDELDGEEMEWISEEGMREVDETQTLIDGSNSLASSSSSKLTFNKSQSEPTKLTSQVRTSTNDPQEIEDEDEGLSDTETDQIIVEYLIGSKPTKSINHQN